MRSLFNWGKALLKRSAPPCALLKDESRADLTPGPVEEILQYLLEIHYIRQAGPASKEIYVLS